MNRSLLGAGFIIGGYFLIKKFLEKQPTEQIVATPTFKPESTDVVIEAKTSDGKTVENVITLEQQEKSYEDLSTHISAIQNQSTPSSGTGSGGNSGFFYDTLNTPEGQLNLDTSIKQGLSDMGYTTQIKILSDEAVTNLNNLSNLAAKDREATVKGIQEAAGLGGIDLDAIRRSLMEQGLISG